MRVGFKCVCEQLEVATHNHPPAAKQGCHTDKE